MNNDKSIWKLALEILGRRAHGDYELRQKLYRKDYAASEIDEVMNRLLTYGYVNDNKLANFLFVKYLQVGKYSLNQIVSKLKQRGLPDDIIKNVTSSYDSEEEQSSALKLITNRFKSFDGINKEKVYRFLGTRGFGVGTIHKVCQQIYDDIDID